jgi:hypothetical protein
LEELNISEWNAADIPKMKNLLIGKSIYNSEIRIGKTFTKAEVLTINRLIQNFIRFIEKDNIHLEYVLHNEAEYYTMPYPIGENLIYKFDLVMLKRHDIRKLRYRDMKYGLIVSNFIIDANLDISCEYYQLEFATVLSLGRL